MHLRAFNYARLPCGLSRRRGVGSQGETAMDQRKAPRPTEAPQTAANSGVSGPTGALHEVTTAVLLTPDANNLISRQLRALYDEVVNEPIPDHITRLLQELERKQADG